MEQVIFAPSGAAGLGRSATIGQMVRRSAVPAPFYTVVCHPVPNSPAFPTGSRLPLDVKKTLLRTQKEGVRRVNCPSILPGEEAHPKASAAHP